MPRFDSRSRVLAQSPPEAPTPVPDPSHPHTWDTYAATMCSDENGAPHAVRYLNAQLAVLHENARKCLEEHEQARTEENSKRDPLRPRWLSVKLIPTHRTLLRSGRIYCSETGNIRYRLLRHIRQTRAGIRLRSRCNPPPNLGK